MLTFPILVFLTIGVSEHEFIRNLYIRNYKIMFRMAFALTSSKHDAEDVVSEACMLLIRKMSSLQCLDHNILEGYIISTVKNAAYMHHRRMSARKEVDGEDILPSMEDEDAAPDEHVLQECTMQELKDAIRALPEGDQAVIRMKYFEKRSDSEIAEVLHIRETSVRSRLTRARKRIYALLRGKL